MIYLQIHGAAQRALPSRQRLSGDAVHQIERDGVHPRGTRGGDDPFDHFAGVLASERTNLIGLERLNADRNPRDSRFVIAEQIAVAHQLGIDFDGTLRCETKSVLQCAEKLHDRLAVVGIRRSAAEVERRGRRARRRRRPTVDRSSRPGHPSPSPSPRRGRCGSRRPSILHIGH